MTERYFLTPVVERVPPRQRTPEIKSVRYRHFLWYWRGTEVVIGDVTYRGGWWHGPLSDPEVNAITAAGFGARIVEVASAAELPADLDSS